MPAEPGWWWKTDPRSSSEGAFAACLYGHVQASSIHERLLDEPEKLRAYQVLYLAGAAHLSPSRIANIKEFVRNGGGLVVSYTSSLYDEAGNLGKRFGLEELIHAAPVEPAGDLADAIANYRSVTGGPYDLYLADHAHPSSHSLTPLWSFQPVKVLEGGRVLMDVVTGDGLRPMLPGVIVSSYGKGRVVYCASALESLFLQNNDSVLRDQIRKLIAEAAETPAPYEVEGPAALIANLTTNGGSLMLHLTNWTGDKLERNGSNTYYLAPVENVRLRIRVPRGKRVRAVRLSVETPYKKTQSASAIELTIPRVEAYQGVRVDLE
jgi:hypothetical protein